MSKTTKTLYVIALLLFFVAGLLMAKYNPWSENNAQASGYGGLGGDFTLQSNQGEVNLSDFRGKLVLMYFGFTSCPDVCPTSLSSIAASMRELAPEQEAMIQPLFQTTQPHLHITMSIKIQYVFIWQFGFWVPGLTCFQSCHPKQGGLLI